MDKAALERKDPEYRLLNIPIKYICISTTSFYPVVNEELQLLSNKIKFPGISNKAGTQKPSSIEINRSSIRLVQYSKTNKLLRVTIQSDTYSKYFTRDTRNEELFKDSIWFCLRIDTNDAYTATIDNLRSNYFSLFIVTLMPPRLYENFTLCLKSQSSNHQQSVIPSPLSEIELSVKFRDIKLSEMSGRGPLAQRKRQKRSLDMPITIRIKRAREQLILNSKLLYQPTPTHSIEIREHDLNCLSEKKYLNDNIINWYMTCIYHEILTDSQREAAHFFNVFFYTKLIGTDKQQRDDSPEMRHSRVSKWTKKVDIFSKDFLVIPVIVNKHWFLVIVCYPWMAGIVNYIELFNKDSTSVSNIPVNNSEFVREIRQKRCQDLENSQNIKPMPCILVFDSIDKHNRSGEVNLIRDYLKSEWDSKRKAKDGPLIFDRSTCRGYSPVVTKQNNNFDCGLYLLQYVESFFKNPLKSYEKSVFESGFKHWFSHSDIVTKRDFIKATIKDKSVEIPHSDNDNDNDDQFIL